MMIDIEDSGAVFQKFASPPTALGRGTFEDKSGIYGRRLSKSVKERYVIYTGKETILFRYDIVADQDRVLTQIAKVGGKGQLRSQRVTVRINM